MKKFIFTLITLITAHALGQSQAAGASHSGGAVSLVSPEKIWADLMQGNERFVSGKAKAREFVQARHILTKGQHPKVAVLSCADSRVPPELLFDKSLGDLFVVRSAGNVADAIGIGSLEYAVEHLGVSVLIVLGHEKCGAVTAACSGEKMPTDSLQAIVDKIDPAVQQAKTYANSETLLGAAIAENVHQSAKDLLGHSEVLRRALKEGKLTMFEAMYHLDSGEVTRIGKLALIAPAYKLDVGDVVRME